jgi:hypothetical protein
MFPKIDKDIDINSPATTVIMSKSANDLNIKPSVQSMSSAERESIGEEGKSKAKTGDLQSLLKSKKSILFLMKHVRNYLIMLLQLLS